MKKIVIIESPYGRNITPPALNLRYLDKVMRYCLLDCDVIPFASHKLFTDCLDDNNEEERKLGMAAGFQISLRVAIESWVFEDLGISPGMKYGIEVAEANGLPVKVKRLPTPLIREFFEEEMTLFPGSLDKGDCLRALLKKTHPDFLDGW